MLPRLIADVGVAWSIGAYPSGRTRTGAPAARVWEKRNDPSEEGSFLLSR